VPFTPEAKRALELALRSALELGHRSIGPAHILLGIVTSGDAAVTDVLDRHGLGPDDVRGAVLDELAHAA
jgi:ATP-dependent Clp protease ATP-binding subunit ClpC